MVEDIRKELSKLMLGYKFAMNDVLSKIEVLQEEFKLIHEYSPIEHVGSRLKHPKSILKKLQHKGLPFTYEAVHQMMPVQTFGLNQLSKEYYGSGSAILNTVQQVAGAIGTALFISIMSSSTESYIEENVTNPQDPIQLLTGALHGFETTFSIAMIFAIVAIVIAFFMKSKKNK